MSIFVKAGLVTSSGNGKIYLVGLIWLAADGTGRNCSARIIGNLVDSIHDGKVDS